MNQSCTTCIGADDIFLINKECLKCSKPTNTTKMDTRCPKYSTPKFSGGSFDSMNEQAKITISFLPSISLESTKKLNSSLSIKSNFGVKKRVVIFEGEIQITLDLEGDKDSTSWIVNTSLSQVVIEEGNPYPYLRIMEGNFTETYKLNAALASFKAVEGTSTVASQSFSTVFSTIGVIFSTQLSGVLLKYFQTIELLEILCFVNSDFGPYFEMIRSMIFSAGFPISIPQDYFIKDPQEETIRVLAGVKGKITIYKKSTFILAEEGLFAIIYLAIWVVFLIFFVVSSILPKSKWKRITLKSLEVLRIFVLQFALNNLMFSGIMEIGLADPRLSKQKNMVEISQFSSLMIVFLASIDFCCLIQRIPHLSNLVYEKPEKKLHPIKLFWLGGKKKQKKRRKIEIGFLDQQLINISFPKLNLKDIGRQKHIKYSLIISQMRFLGLMVSLIALQSSKIAQTTTMCLIQVGYLIYALRLFFPRSSFESLADWMQILIFEIGISSILFLSFYLSIQETIQSLGGKEFCQWMVCIVFILMLAIESCFVLFEMIKLLFSFCCKKQEMPSDSPSKVKRVKITPPKSKRISLNRILEFRGKFKQVSSSSNIPLKIFGRNISKGMPISVRITGGIGKNLTGEYKRNFGKVL